MADLSGLDREQLAGMLEDFAKNWLAHDGLWFLEVEKHAGMDTAIELDRNAWRQFTVIEAKRIMARHGIAEGSGLAGLKTALRFRLYAFLNEQEFFNETETSFEFAMTDCRVQSARHRKELPPFPCKTVGIVEYSEFARTIDRRIRTECIHCPPDANAGVNSWCRWRFSLD